MCVVSAAVLFIPAPRLYFHIRYIPWFFIGFGLFFFILPAQLAQRLTYIDAVNKQKQIEIRQCACAVQPSNTSVRRLGETQKFSVKPPASVALQHSTASQLATYRIPGTILYSPQLPQ